MRNVGVEILTKTLSIPSRTDRHGNLWNYHSRSDHHSKVACWAIVFDLMMASPLLRAHVEAGRVGFGINVRLRDFQQDRSKDLDLVIGQPASDVGTKARTLGTFVESWRVDLDDCQRKALAGMPTIRECEVGNVLLALEAKACMTAHQRALPRLYDELNSSHSTVHGAHDMAIAAGFVMINIADLFLSPDLNKKNRMVDPEWSSHKQPKSVEITIDKVKQLPRRSKIGIPGYDALSIVVVECRNDGSPVLSHSGYPAPQPGDNYHYSSMIDRIAGLYATRFAQI